MRKVLLIGVIIILFSIIGWRGSVFAAVEFEEFYMVDAWGSTLQKDVYDWDEIPWLYFKFDSLSSGFTEVMTTWTSPTSDMYIAIWKTEDSSWGGWISLGDWATKRELGLWNVDGEITSGGESGGVLTASTSFTVVPEPVSSILFLSGGTILAIRVYRKKLYIF